MKEQIKTALMDLMTEKCYMDITVTDIVNKAEVARASFYRNFDSVSDVIDAIVGEVSDEFVVDLFPALRSGDQRKIRELLFEYFYRFAVQHKKMAAMDCQNSTVIFGRMDNKIYDKQDTYLAESVKEKYALYGKFGLINNIVKKWVKGGMEESPEEVIDYIMIFLTSF